MIEIFGQSSLEYISSHITYENGFALGYTRNIIQDSTGLLWITGGRGIGLHCYDGKKVKTFHQNNKARYFPLAQSYVAAEMTDGNILCSDWSDKLYIFNPYNKQVVDSISQASDSPKNIYHLTIDDAGTIWAVTMPFGENKNSILLLKSSNGEPLSIVRKVSVNNYPQVFVYKEKILITADGAILIFAKDGTFIKESQLNDGSKVVSPYGFSIDGQGSLWMKTAHQLEEKNRSSALFKFNEIENQFEVFELKDNRPLIDTESIEIIGDDLWIFGVQEKLWKVDMKTWKTTDYTDALRSVTDKNFYILNVWQDDSEQLWVTTSRGLIKLTPAKKEKIQTAIRKQDGFCEGNCSVQSITASDTAIYFSYLYETIAMSKKTKKFYPLNYNLKNLSKGSLLESVWDEGAQKLSIYNNQLVWLDQIIDLTSLKGIDLLPSQSDYRVVNCLIGDHTLWLAPYYPTRKDQQLFEYNFKTKQLRNISPDLDIVNEDYPLQILESKKHNKVWVATEERGVLEFTKSGEYIRNYKDESINQNNCLYEDKNGTLWIGTQNGLTKVNIQTGDFKNIDNKTYNYQGREKTIGIRSFVEVDENTLWLGGRSGMHRFSLEKERFNTPELPSQLKEVECSFTAAHLEPNGDIYFGTKNGIIIFNYKDILSGSSYNTTFPIGISEITLYNNKEEKENIIQTGLAERKEIKLSPQDLWFSLEYFLPHYEESDKTLYSYMLEGYDTDWSFPSVDNSLKYTNLPPGEYTLHLRAGHDESALDKYSRSLKVIVRQAWYKSIWFILLCFLSAIGLMYLGLRYRYQQQLEKQLAIERLRTKISSDLHDDVGSILTGLAMQTEIMSMSKKDKEKESMMELTSMSRDAMERMRDIVWAMDARKDKYENLIDRMRDFARRNLEPKEIEYEFDLEKINMEETLQPNVRQQMYLIFKEALTNIVKHSDAKNVNIGFSQNKKIVTLTIHDNGSKKPIQKSDGLGMSNMKKRAKDIGGTLSFDYENGYKVSAQVPT